MRIKGETPQVRRSLVLHETTQRRLKELKERTELESDSDVVRQALRYYEELIFDVQNNKELLFRDDDENDYVLSATSDEGGETSENVGPLKKRNLILSEQSERRIDALRQATDASSDSKLVREALRVFDLLVENALAGKRLIVRDLTSHREREYLIPGLRPRLPRQVGCQRLFSRLPRFSR